MEHYYFKTEIRMQMIICNVNTQH